MLLERAGTKRCSFTSDATHLAARATLLEAGHGIVRTSVVLVAGFSVGIAADYMPVSSGGAVLCATLVAAVWADLSLVPAMARLGLLEPSAWGKVGPPTLETRL